MYQSNYDLECIMYYVINYVLLHMNIIFKSLKHKINFDQSNYVNIITLRINKKKVNL